MKGNESKSQHDWELVRLPSLFIRMSPDGETATRETLREAITHQEHIDSNVADRVIQSAIDDGIIDRENGEVIRLNEGADNQLEDFYHVE